MNIIFLGLMFCEESLQDEFKTMKRKISMAPHKFQWNIIKGIENQKNVDVSVINVPPTGSFPINSRRLYSKTYMWGGKNKQIGYINLPWIKHKIQNVKLYRQIRQEIAHSEETYLIIYSLYEPFLKIAEKIKVEYPEVCICLIHTDAVPGRDDMEKYMNRAAKKRGDRAVKYAKIIDKFILITENLVEPLEVGERPYMVVECLCDEMQKSAEIEDNVSGSFLYTGEVCKEFGIYELAKVFQKKANLQLWICGDGDASNEIKELSSQCSNIRYFGYVTPEKIKILQNKCAFLINPRRPSGTYTKYSFPSKTAEYMMTGKPVVMYKLEAIPDEYDKYINYLTSTSLLGMENEIQTLVDCEYADLLETARKGRNYMINNKNTNEVGKRIIDFLKENEF